MQVIQVPWVLQRQSAFQEHGSRQMVAKMVCPSDDFVGYGRIRDHKGTGINPS